MISKYLVFLTLVCCWFGNAMAGELLDQGNFTYIGAFRVPPGNLGGDSTEWSFGLGGEGVTYNPARNSLILLGTDSERYVIEISIPTPVNSTNINDLNTATTVQTPKNITGNMWNWLNLGPSFVENGGEVGGFLVYNGKLIGSAFPMYDDGATFQLSHFTANLNWVSDGAGFSGFKQVGTNPENALASSAGWVGGYMAHIPSEWQASLGYPVLTGNGAINIIGRSSRGPALFGLDPDQIGVQTPAPTTVLAGYPAAHPTLGDYSTTTGTLYYNMSTSLSGAVFPAGSDSVLVFGRHGITLNGQGSDVCYGFGTANIALHKTIKEGTDLWCYDPTDSDKGGHGYPYASQVWAYDANDLLAVKNGTKQYWEVVPYARWTLSLPFTNETSSTTGTKKLGGVAYDPSTQRIFVVQLYADHWADEYEPNPIVHVYQLNLESSYAAINGSGQIHLSGSGTMTLQ